MMWSLQISSSPIYHNPTRLLKRLRAVSLFLESPRERTQNREVSVRTKAVPTPTLPAARADRSRHRRSHVTLTVTLARLLLLRSFSRIFEELYNSHEPPMAWVFWDRLVESKTSLFLGEHRLGQHLCHRITKVIKTKACKITCSCV